ncbi:GNAT family N-acetyltransferase [Rossellomorea marisflavi]|uniref:GNAT family N-acetyltransferase n=1 Tax=Rossellomorea marisflavi TaxID=189381 RepID=UPI0020411214|nr:GNAT family N-acetyltransferase [Rossellomorea marisflavi]MCM2587794.1 GNAT family N-acetyltransferase [Rossellomorea marisflavi]
MDISRITLEECEEAKNLILEGFRERFGWIDDTLNPDIKDIAACYDGVDNHFFVGKDQQGIVCTGALKRQGVSTYEIVRMSVRADMRSKGLGRTMLQHLEDAAKSLKAVKLVLETNRAWEDAVGFYKRSGFINNGENESRFYFEKILTGPSRPSSVSS